MTTNNHINPVTGSHQAHSVILKTERVRFDPVAYFDNNNNNNNNSNNNA